MLFDLIKEYLADNVSYNSYVDLENSMRDMEESFIPYRDILKYSFSDICDLGKRDYFGHFKELLKSDLSYNKYQHIMDLMEEFLENHVDFYTLSRYDSLEAIYSGFRKQIPWKEFKIDELSDQTKAWLISHRYSQDLDFDKEFITFDETSRLSDLIDWDYVSDTYPVTEELLDRFSDKLNMKTISLRRGLSESMIDKHGDKLYWNYVLFGRTVPERLIDKYSDKIDWQFLSRSYRLSDFILDKYSDRIDWQIASQYQKLSDSILDKYSDRIDWQLASQYQKLSDSILDKYSDRIDWQLASQYQKLSD